MTFKLNDFKEYINPEFESVDSLGIQAFKTDCSGQTIGYKQASGKYRNGRV